MLDGVHVCCQLSDSRVARGNLTSAVSTEGVGPWEKESKGRGVVSESRRAVNDISGRWTTRRLPGPNCIHGELLKLGLTVSESTVAKYLRRHPRPRGGHRTSDSGLDGTTTSQCLSRERGSSIFTPRSRYGLCRCGNHGRRDEHPSGSHRTALAVAERLRGARHRLDSTRVPRSRDRDECGRAPPCDHELSRVLHALAHPSRPCQGHTARATGLTAVGWTQVATPEVGGLHHSFDRIAA